MLRGLVLALAFGVVPLLGKNLDGRLGFGFTYLEFLQSPSLSVKYFHTPLIATHVMFAFNTQNSQYEIGVKPSRLVVLEENMNLYLGVAAFLFSNPSSSSATGTEFDALVGGEFFLPGLPNLGFLFEAGLGLRSWGTTSFRSAGGGFTNGAIHYYF